MIAWIKQGLGLGIILEGWRIVNGKHYAQDQFAVYLKMANGLPPTPANWLAVRWLSLCNTFVPLHLFFFDVNNQSIVLEGPPPAIVRFFIECWTSLPSGVGLIFYPCLIYWLFLAWRRARAWLLLMLVLPLACFAVYWGAFTGGLLREGLHPWTLGALALGACCWLRYGSKSKMWWRFASFALLTRGLEALAMMVVPAMVMNKRVLGSAFPQSDSICLCVLVTACAILYFSTFRLCEQLRTAKA